MADDIIHTTITGKCGPNRTLENCHSLVVDIIEGIADITSSGRKITNFKLEIDHIPMDESEMPQKVTGTVYQNDDGSSVYILDDVEDKMAELQERKESEEEPDGA